MFAYIEDLLIPYKKRNSDDIQVAYAEYTPLEQARDRLRDQFEFLRTLQRDCEDNAQLLVTRLMTLRKYLLFVGTSVFDKFYDQAPGSYAILRMAPMFSNLRPFKEFTGDQKRQICQWCTYTREHVYNCASAKGINVPNGEFFFTMKHVRYYINNITLSIVGEDQKQDGYSLAGINDFGFSLGFQLSDFIALLQEQGDKSADIIQSYNKIMALLGIIYQNCLPMSVMNKVEDLGIATTRLEQKDIAMTTEDFHNFAREIIKILDIKINEGDDTYYPFQSVDITESNIDNALALVKQFSSLCITFIHKDNVTMTEYTQWETQVKELFAHTIAMLTSERIGEFV
jgi:hypothetical protein